MLSHLLSARLGEALPVRLHGLGDTKVRELDVAVRADKNVVGLDIAMKDTLGMKVVQCKGELGKVEHGQLLRQAVLGQALQRQGLELDLAGVRNKTLRTGGARTCNGTKEQLCKNIIIKN